MGIPENLKRLRKKNNLNQEQLAEKIGVSQRAVSAWERGLRTPRLKQIKILCDFFQISPGSLYDDPKNFTIKAKNIDNFPKDFNLLTTEQLKNPEYRKNMAKPYKLAYSKEPKSEIQYLTIPDNVLYTIEDDSMFPIYQKNSRVMITLLGPYEHGDIVIFDVLNSHRIIVRLFIYDKNNFCLHSLDKNFPAINLSEESKNYSYIGTVNVHHRYINKS